jgi:molybdopterin-guanine dinucleotide biosynthesis protein A
VIDAIVLAGGGLERERFPELDPGIQRKAQIPILGRPVVEHVVRALRETSATGRIVVVGHPSLASDQMLALDAQLVPEAGDIAANLRAGLDALPGAERVLALSGDLPLVTPAALSDLFSRAPDADVVFPVVERDAVLRAFPGREWMFARSPDGAFTGSSAFLFHPGPVLGQWRWVEDLLGARRKSPFQLALMIGLPMALRYLWGRLRIADVEQKLSELLHVTGRAYRSPFPELAMDVDKLADIVLAEETLRHRSS